MSTVTKQDQKFYLVKQLSVALKERGMPMTVERIHHYIRNGQIKASRDLLRPKLYVVARKELLRLVNQGIIQE